jgi:hypothetical protein
MSEPFVPFATTRSKPGSARDGFRLTILPQAPQVQPFLPVSVPASAAPANPKEPQVTVERDGDRITRITIQCPCGQVLELNCTY